VIVVASLAGKVSIAVVALDPVFKFAMFFQMASRTSRPVAQMVFSVAVPFVANRTGVRTPKKCR